MDADLTTVEPIRNIERLRRLLPLCPVILYASDSHWELGGGGLFARRRPYFKQARRGRAAQFVVGRLFAAGVAPEQGAAPPPPAPRGRESARRSGPHVPARMLELLRNCSSILCHSLCAESLLREFLLLLREILGVNRAAIFLAPRPRTDGGTVRRPCSQRLTSACALGLSPGVLENFELSLDAGIGGYSSAPAASCAGTARRWSGTRAWRANLICWACAWPSLCWTANRWSAWPCSTSGSTGEPMSNDELALIFLLLEQLGLAIKNIWLARTSLGPARNDV